MAKRDLIHEAVRRALENILTSNGKRKKYKKIIRDVLEHRASLKISNAPELERHLIINKEQTEFVLITLGWHEKSYRHGLVFHIEIKKGKVWVHEDNTDVGIAAKFARSPG